MVYERPFSMLCVAAAAVVVLVVVLVALLVLVEVVEVVEAVVGVVGYHKIFQYTVTAEPAKKAGELRTAKCRQCR